MKPKSPNDWSLKSSWGKGGKDLPQVDNWGTGRRKTAVARVRVVPGSGRIVVNGKPFEEVFVLKTQQNLVLEAITAARATGKFDFIATVEGGGIAGQAGALRLGIARALQEFDSEMRKPLKKGGFLTRDPRMKERKKYGLKKARKAPQFSKR